MYGAERVILNLAKKALLSDYEACVLCFNDIRCPHLELFEKAKEEGIAIELIECKKRIDLKALLRLISIVKNYKVDILHCHESKSNTYGMITAKLLHIPVISTNHLWTKESFIIRCYEYIDGFCLRLFDKVIAVSDEIEKQLLQYHIPKESIRVIYNGIDLDEFQFKYVNHLRKELKIEPNSPVIGIIGRLTIQKGHEYFLNAAKEVLLEYPNVNFVVVGDGPLKDKLRNYVKILKIEDNVTFTGFRKDMIEIYSLLDILVSCSLREGTPMVILEAMAMKKPVIAMDVGGVSTLIQRENGILLKPRDVEGLYNAILSLLKDRKRARKLGENGRKLVEEKFSSEVMASKYKRIYTEILEKYRQRKNSDQTY